MHRLLINSLAREFYLQHAGIFLFGIYILFGVVEPSQLISYQKSLLLAGISSPAGLVFVFISWFVYSMKAYFFVKLKRTQTKYNFIRETASLAKNVQLKLWFGFYIVILLPVLVYVFLLIALSINYHLYLSMISIAIVFSALAFGLSWLSSQAITYHFLKPDRRIKHFDLKIKKKFFSWPLFHLLKAHTLMLVLCKLLSFFIFRGILWVFADVGNDIRVLLVALLASVLCHAVLVFNLLKFETEYLNFSKSIEIPLYRRLLNWLLVFTIVLLPEYLLLISAAHLNLYFITNEFLFGISGLMSLLTLLYIVRLNMENYLKWLLFYFFISMWSILGHYYFLLSLTLLIVSFIYFVTMYYKSDLTILEE